MEQLINTVGEHFQLVFSMFFVESIVVSIISRILIVRPSFHRHPVHLDTSSSSPFLQDGFIQLLSIPPVRNKSESSTLFLTNNPAAGTPSVQYHRSPFVENVPETSFSPLPRPLPELEQQRQDWNVSGSPLSTCLWERSLSPPRPTTRPVFTKFGSLEDLTAVERVLLNLFIGLAPLIARALLCYPVLPSYAFVISRIGGRYPPRAVTMSATSCSEGNAPKSHL